MTAKIATICVVGAGVMGRQIALCAALAGYAVKCTDVAMDSLVSAQEYADSYLSSRVRAGKLAESAAKQAQRSLSWVPALKQAASDADFVIEAVSECLSLKKRVFSELDQHAPRHAILATNSSYIVSSKIAEATNRPDKVCNMHFFNPALVMKLVEVARGPQASDQAIGVVMDLARSMGKIPVLLKREIYGLLVNRMAGALTAEALRLLDMDIASIEDIDTAVVNGLGHPMGPLGLIDLIGVDLHYHIAMERYRETGDPADKPSPAIVERYTRGDWGRKAGRGFHQYPARDP